MMNNGNLQASSLDTQQKQQQTAPGLATGPRSQPSSSSMPSNGSSSAAVGAASMAAGRASSVPSHLMGLMTNPALAAAAAASPLFPPAAFLSNPGAYLSMPEAYAAGAMQAAAAAAAAGGGASNGISPHHGLVLSQSSLNGMNPFLVSMSAASLHPLPSHTSSADLSSFDDGSSSHRMMTTGATAVTHSLKHVHGGGAGGGGGGSGSEPQVTVQERQQQNRDRNREHARSTRLRKKAYVAKLKELVEGLHAERTEEVRQRRIAIQSLSEMQNVRRSVVRSFLRYYASYEADERKWSTLLEDKFALKQPVTPYRSFRSSEIEKVRPSSQHFLTLCDAEAKSHPPPFLVF
jgi:hypothetical protein